MPTYKWDSLKAMPTKRVFSTPVEADGKLYILGGCDARGTPIDNVEAYDPQKKSWARLANLPTPRAGTAAGAVGKKVVAMGGVSTTQEPLDVVEIYDIEKKKWTTGETLKEKLLGLVAVVRGKVKLTRCHKVGMQVFQGLL